jgi:hypothetical protein
MTTQLTLGKGKKPQVDRMQDSVCIGCIWTSHCHAGVVPIILPPAPLRAGRQQRPYHAGCHEACKDHAVGNLLPIGAQRRGPQEHKAAARHHREHVASALNRVRGPTLWADGIGTAASLLCGINSTWPTYLYMPASNNDCIAPNKAMRVSEGRQANKHGVHQDSSIGACKSAGVHVSCLCLPACSSVPTSQDSGCRQLELVVQGVLGLGVTCGRQTVLMASFTLTSS